MLQKLTGGIICLLLGIILIILGISIWDVEDSPNRFILLSAGSFAILIGITNLINEIYKIKLQKKLTTTEESEKTKKEEKPSESIKNTMMTFIPVLFGIISLGAGLLIGSLEISRKIEFDKNGISVTAQVEQVVTHSLSRGRKDVNVNIVFYTENNEEIKTTFKTRYPTPIKAGQELAIKYHKNNPNLIHTGGSIKLTIYLCIIFVIIGLAIIAAAIVNKAKKYA